MQLLRPKTIGKIPDGLPPYQRDFWQWIKDSIEILSGIKKSQSDTTNPPRSMAITYQDLTDLLAAVPQYADNAAALAGGLSAGDLYRTTDTLKVVHS